MHRDDEDTRRSTERRMLTIDGPAGTGKSVTARALAERLRLHYLDSGAFYRAVAWLAREGGVTGPRDPAVAALLAVTRVDAHPAGCGFSLHVGGKPIDDALRDESVGRLASELATDAGVREWVREQLQALAGRFPCVAEGRDMGSTVFPGAGLKVYLTASLAERAQRRLRQLAAQGITADPSTVRDEMAARDARDAGRDVSPLRVPDGAVRIDSTDLTLEEQIGLIEEVYREGGHRKGTRLYRFVRALARFFYLRLLGARLVGGDRLPPGAFLLAANHQSYHDPPLLASVMRPPVAFMAKAELFRPPVFGPLIRALGALPVRRGLADRNALKMSLSVLRHARPIIIFPQGTRVREGAGRTNTGVAWLARRAQVPVVPVYISGSDWKTSLLRQRPITVRVGEPLRPWPEASRESDADFAEAVMNAIRSLGDASRQSP